MTDQSPNQPLEPGLSLSALTPKQRLIVQLVAQGLKNSEIAPLVGVTELVVKNYLRVIYDKTGMWTRLELALWYMSRVSENGMDVPAK